jgi:hypothetical protein
VGKQPTRSGGEAAAQQPVLSGAACKRAKIGIREMSRAPDHVAREIPSLSLLSATRPQLVRRRDPEARSCSPAVICDPQLATEEDVASADYRAPGDGHSSPETRRSSA